MYANAIKLYTYVKGQINSRQGQPSENKISKRVKQGYPLSPLLFKIYMILAIKRCSKNGKILGSRLVDDQLLLTEDEQSMIRNLFEEFEE